MMNASEHRDSTASPIRIALAGFGTVGTGVARLLIERGQALRDRTGLSFEIPRVLVRNPNRPRGVALPAATLVTSPDDLLAGEPVDMLVEVMGGTTVARELVLATLRAGLPVVTANKALLAMHGREVFATAREHGTCVAFEASCAGGVPVIAEIQRGLIANRINALHGIVNGTCNFILTQMLEQGQSYDDALRDAQRLGYAEADPTLDVNGTDSAHKLAILASLAFGADVAFDRVESEGIENVDRLDLEIARALGYACKLLAIGRRTDAGLSLRVHPSLVPLDHPLAITNGPLSGVAFEGDAMDRLVVTGSGAGELPTASAVVSDVVEVACGNAQRTFDQLRLFSDRNAPPTYVPPGSEMSRFYARCELGTQSSPDDVAKALAREGVAVAKCESADRHVSAPGAAGCAVVITQPVREDAFDAAIGELCKTGVITAVAAAIRIVEPS